MVCNEVCTLSLLILHSFHQVKSVNDQGSREGISDIVHQQISGRKRFYKVVNVEERNPKLVFLL